MNDRELLELAAKAAGMRHIKYTNDYDGSQGLVLCDEIGRHKRSWNPRTDDGDALRLAVKLGLLIDCDDVLNESEAVFTMHGDDDDYFRATEPYGDDPYAATRRAIVRAAAEIGKMELCGN